MFNPKAITELVCAKFYIGAQAVLADKRMLIENAHIEVYADACSDRFIAELRTWAIKGVKGHRAFLYFPANCWEHFKQDYFPEWMLARFPVKQNAAPYISYFVCPHSDVKWPDQKHFSFLMHGGWPDYEASQDEV